MRMRAKSQEAKELISLLDRKGKAWKAVARGLNRPRRVSYSVSVDDIERFADGKGTVVVPGKVLGNGEIKKALTVAAFRFSAQARAKVEKAGGKALDIQELMKRNPEGKGLRIMG